MTRALRVAVWALVGASCIGRPVVDEVEPDDGSDLCEEDTLSCLDWGAPLEFPRIAEDAFAAPDACSDDVVEMRLGQETSSPTNLPIEVAALDFSCRTVKLTLAPGANDVTLVSPRLDRTRLEVVSEGDTTLTILAPSGNAAHLELSGRSTLRLRALESLTGWRVDATGRSRGWDLEVEDSDLEDVAFGVGADARLLVRQSRLVGTRILAGTLSLQGATIEDATLDAETLVSAGTTLRSGEVRARLGSFGSGNVEGSRFYGCDSFLFRETAVDRSDLGACNAAPVQLNNASLSASIVRGRLFAVQTRFIDCVLGAEPGASVSLIDSRLIFSLLCEVEAISARGGSVVTCARCAPITPRAACIDEESSVTVVACPSVATANTCDAELPDSLLLDPDAGVL